MTVASADTVQVAIVEETVPGTTPATPAFKVWRLTDESVIFSPETSESGELGSGGRSAYPDQVVGTTVSGDINFELAKFDALDDAIGGVLASVWGQCPLTGAAGGRIEAGRVTVGQGIRTFTIEKRFPDVANPGQYLYQRYKGASFSALTLTAAPNEKITGTVSVVGGVPELASAAIAGATYAPPAQNAVFTAPKVLTIDIGSILGIGTHCWTSLEINIDSQNRGIPCIGTQGDREVALGKLLTNISGEIYFVDQAILQAMLDETNLGDGVITFSNADNEIYRFDLFGLKVTSSELVASGTGEDLTIPLELQPTPEKVCDDGVNDWNTPFIISNVDTVPPALP